MNWVFKSIDGRISYRGVFLSKEEVMELYGRYETPKRFCCTDIWDEEAIAENSEFSRPSEDYTEEEVMNGEVPEELWRQDTLRDEQRQDTGYNCVTGETWELNNGPMLRVMIRPGTHGKEIGKLLRALAFQYERWGIQDPRDLGGQYKGRQRRLDKFGIFKNQELMPSK